VCSATSSDPLCPAVTCQGQSSECRPLDNGQAGVNCEGVGVCRAGADCTPVPAAAGTPCQEGTGTCDGQGACLVANKSALGAACAADTDCAEGHCVATGQEGVRLCCDAACDGACQACSAAGRCEETPATDARCEPVTCPADNVCRDYPPSITEDLCRSFGQCRTALDCGAPDAFSSLRPTAQCVCDPVSGSCALATGTSCAQSGECASGACVATAQGTSVCCAGPCAPGLLCSSAGGGCVECEGADVACDGDTQRTCNAGAVVRTPCPNGCTPGTGCNDLPPVGFACSGQCAGAAVCQADTAGQSRCCVRDCAAEGKVCSPNGSCDCPPGQVAAGNGCLLEAGDPCQRTTQCQAGMTCVDGVCCQEACGGYCERCQAGTGLCSAVAAGQQEVDAASGNSCSNGFECTGVRNDCRARTGQACSSSDGSDCVSGACEATAGGGARVCCNQDCGAGLFCRSNGQGCVQCESAAQCGNGCNAVQGTCNPLRSLGDTCTLASQCGSNSCVPDVNNGSISRCCGACSPGQVCNGIGQCVPPPSGLGRGCVSNAECASGFCAPEGICCNAACDRVCEACSANGQCQATPNDDECSPVPCDSLAGGCKTSQRLTTNLCRAAGACKTTSDCSFANIPDGTVCGNAAAGLLCQNGSCVSPQVTCGFSTCSIDQVNVCCSRGVESGAAAGYSCESTGTCFTSGILEPIQPVECDSPDDCTPGNVCCLDITVNARFASLSCRPASECNIDELQTDPPQLRFAQLCQSLSFSGACPAGRPCIGTGDGSILPGFAFCGPP
jgi:hypothetical protein